MNMIRKGQIGGVGKGDIKGQVSFIAGLFGVGASAEQEGAFRLSIPLFFFAHNRLEWPPKNV